MYRDDLEAYRARLSTALKDRDAAWRAVEKELELIALLGEQLRGQGHRAPQPPTVTPPASIPALTKDSEATEIVRLAGQAEEQSRRLLARRDALSRLSRLLNRRVQGEDVTMPLGEPPRRVPLAYVFAEMAPTLLLALAAAGVVGGFFANAEGPQAALIVLLLPGVVFAVGVIRGLFRARFLSRCREATSAAVVEHGGGTSSMTNWPVRRSRGWEVVGESYTGSGSRDRVQFLTQEGETGTVVVGGVGYDSGVILYDPQTMRAYDVKQLSCHAQPDADGYWRAAASGTVARMVLFIAAVSLWVGTIGLTLYSLVN